jgi:hypothetical protein
MNPAAQAPIAAGSGAPSALGPVQGRRALCYKNSSRAHCVIEFRLLLAA